MKQNSQDKRVSYKGEVERGLYNPDVLNCIANLSNDEVFTPPELANKVLDLLPQELFCNPNTTFLDPFTKSGVFLREIVKRLDRGLESQIPDRQERIDHILHKQVFGIAITELTSMLARRSVYCSKKANSQFSISKFDTECGNIIYKNIKHTWENGKCKFCGASQAVYDRGSEAEQYAYMFIHTNNPKIFFPNMKFDVIVGNPPYQMNVGVDKENYAIALYHKFVLQAKKLNPRFLSMIIPARWYAGGRGLDEFRDEMLHDNRISIILDYPNSTDCFPGVDLSGGVCVFLWNNNKNKDEVLIKTYKGGLQTSQMSRPLLEKGLDTFIRHNNAINILRKVQAHKENTFDSIVGPQTPFGFVSSFRDFKEQSFPHAITYYTYGYKGYVSRNQISKNPQWVDTHKVYISKAYGERGDFPYLFLGKPFYGEPESCCSQTYLVIGPFKNKEICDNVITYITTKFFRCMVMLKKNAQDNMCYVFGCVPLQDFSHPWTDEMLYKKYGLTQEEIAFIESMIRPME